MRHPHGNDHHGLGADVTTGPNPDVTGTSTPEVPDSQEAGQPTAAARPDDTGRAPDAPSSSPTTGGASGQTVVAPGTAAPVGRGPAVEQVAWSLRVTAEWSWRVLVVGLALYVLVKVYGMVHLVAFSFIIGLLIAAVLRPLHVRLMKAHFPPALAALSTVLLAVVVLGGVGYFVVDQITSNTTELGDQLSRSVEQIRDWLVTGPLHLKQTDLNSVSDKITTTIRDNSTTIAGSVVDTAARVAEALSGVLLVILTSFFLIKDGDKIWAWTISMLPRAARPRVHEAGKRSWATLGGYVRGQVIIALFHSITITIALFAFGVPLAAPLGVLIFLGSFIPVIGLVIAGTLAVLITLLEHGFITALVIAIIVVALVQLEGHVLQPLIMSRAVSIHPLAVALGVIAGTALDGISGALLAVPLLAVANTAFKSLHGVAADDRPVRVPRPRVRRPKSRGNDRPPATTV